MQAASLFAGAFAIAVAFTGCSQTVTGPDGAPGVGVTDGTLTVVSQLPPPTARAEGDPGVLAIDDSLEFNVFQVPELMRTVKVDPEGRITLPLIGSVEAAGLTPRELEGVLRRRYGARYIEDPEITVTVRQSAAARVAVEGTVAKPGIYIVDSRSSVLRVLAQAGGLTELADENKLYIFRVVDGQRLVASHSVAAIRAGRAPDTQIYGGDIVVGFASDAKIAMKTLRETFGTIAAVTRVVPAL